MATITDFEDLDIWKMARKLCQDVDKIINTTSLKDDYKLRDQINASSGSIMDNIAEGFERSGKKEFRQFLSISKGSCGECRSQLYRIHDRNYITRQKFESLKEETIIIGRKIGSFIKYLNNSNYTGIKYKE
ncbi:MAG: four helix bundle protein [Bacteroidetes bacterium]|jgi:four helix bundle protein|nr:four helix bundle protein [Bacteroidota bacterium]|tara:strand:- start:674 stop:1066 length:393 start_codon:yes stop_codon:yes gene_type:complete